LFSYQNIIVKTDDKIGRIILDRKQSNNSLDTSISKEIFEAMVALQKLKQIRLITIHGNKKFFSPGADIRELESLDKKSAKEKKLFSYFDKNSRNRNPHNCLCRRICFGWGYGTSINFRFYYCI